MNQELNHQMGTMIMSAFKDITTHYDRIQQEWTAIYKHLEERGSHAAPYFNRAMMLFFDLIKLYKDNKTHVNLLEYFHMKWIQEIQGNLQPNLILYILTLMENAVFQIVHPVAVTDKQYLGIQFLFIKLSEVILMKEGRPDFNEASLLETIVKSRQSPIIWIARIVKDDQQYTILKVYTHNDEEVVIEPQVSMLHMTEATLQACAECKEVIAYPFNNETLLLGINTVDRSSLFFFLQLLTHLVEAEEVHSPSYARNDWKDAVVMFSELIIRSQTMHEAIQNITYGFVQFLKFERCALFAYSDKDGNGFGLTGYHVNKEDIKGIEEDIGKIPLIYKSLSRLQPLGDKLYYYQPLYIGNIINALPKRYIDKFQLTSLVVAPIYCPSRQQLIGAAILDCGPDTFFEMESETLLILKKFGRLAGELMSKFLIMKPDFLNELENVSLSTRELDVLKLLADGASTTEAAELLKLSEYTVRDYISNLMKRLQARNRTEAVVKAIRMGIIQ